MNINRGLLRIWLVLSTIFVLGTLTLSYNQIFNEFKNRYAPWKPPADASPMLPTDCKLARGVKSNFDDAQLKALSDEKARFAASGNKEPIATTQNYDYFKSSENTHCWYELPKFRVQFPEYNDISDQKLSDSLYEKAFGLTPPVYAPWSLLLETILFSISVPLGFLALGWLTLWAIAGFKSSPN